MVKHVHVLDIRVECMYLSNVHKYQNLNGENTMLQSWLLTGAYHF
jgi:hypothetical protein